MGSASDGPCCPYPSALIDGEGCLNAKRAAFHCCSGTKDTAPNGQGGKLTARGGRGVDTGSTAQPVCLFSPADISNAESNG
jgi:hypothetical protein